jgi:hypothetical protein
MRKSAANESSFRCAAAIASGIFSSVTAFLLKVSDNRGLA